jgi:hypothetical protein
VFLLVISIGHQTTQELRRWLGKTGEIERPGFSDGDETVLDPQWYGEEGERA